MPVSTDHTIIKVIVITLIFLMAAAFQISYIHLYNNRKKKHQEEKERLKVEFEEELLKTQMEVQEQTLQTIASDIHDNIGQLLSLTRLTLSTVNVTDFPEKSQEKISTSLDLLSISIRELRQLASVLHAENILSTGLDGALSKELSWISRSGKYKVAYDVLDKNEKIIDPNKEIIVFRLIQELLNNILKHAYASEIDVQLQYKPIGIQITISDNGIGFDLGEKTSNPTGLGINNLYKRAHIVGGELVIESDAQNGTKATLTIPYSS